MRPNNKKSPFSSHPTSSPRRRSSDTRAAVLDRPILSLDGKEGFVISDGNPRSFPYAVKQQCWEKAERVKGRDQDRWRRDPLGNLVFRKLVGCPGCLCHDYDNILPYSKGGKSTLENCQVLQWIKLREFGYQKKNLINIVPNMMISKTYIAWQTYALSCFSHTVT